MGSALLEMPAFVTPSFEVDTIGALDATTSGETSVIRRADESLIRQLTEALDRQLLLVLSCRSVAECERARQQVWHNYVRARRALTDTISLVVPQNVIEQVRAATAERVAAELPRVRNVLFGDRVADQVEFTIWITGRMQAIGHAISRAGNARDRAADTKLLADFNLYTMWAQFHYDCVLAAMKFELPIPQEIQGAICDGLRAWVNASAIMEEALALRVQRVEKYPEVEFPWDEEDQELLDASMKDLASDAAKDNL